VLLREALLEVIDPAEDSLRIYPLDEVVRRKIEHHGVHAPLDLDGPLII